MKKRGKEKFIRIVKSCITGNVVWVYQGISKESAGKIYRKARKREVELVKNWNDMMERRMRNITKLLTDCLADFPINAQLTPEQKAAARSLRMMSKTPYACHRDFYEHIMERQRIQKEDSEIRRKMKMRKMENNPCYDK